MSTGAFLNNRFYNYKPKPYERRKKKSEETELWKKFCRRRKICRKFPPEDLSGKNVFLCGKIKNFPGRKTAFFRGTIYKFKSKNKQKNKQNRRKGYPKRPFKVKQ